MTRHDNASAYLDDLLSSLNKAIQLNIDRATFLQAAAQETTSDLLKMCYLSEGSGLLQANINIRNQLIKDGLM